MFFVLLFLISIFIKESTSKGSDDEVNFINSWVVNTRNSVWDNTTDYCSWAGFTCDGSGNLKTINYTCPFDFYGAFPPADQWMNAKSSRNAFTSVDSITFTDCGFGLSIPSWYIPNQQGAAFKFAVLYSSDDSPYFNCPISEYRAKETQFTCSPANIVSLSRTNVARAGGDVVVVTVNKPITDINVQCQFGTPDKTVAPTDISFEVGAGNRKITKVTCVTPRRPSGGRYTFTLTVDGVAVTSGYYIFYGGCVGGFYSSTVGGNCVRCPIGTFSNTFTDGTPCTQCPAGTYASLPQQLQCTPCPEGTVSYPGSSVCTVCPAGYLASNKRDSCQACPIGSYASFPGSTKCTVCPPGSESKTIGGGDCTLCAPGFYREKALPGPVAGVCQPCPKGTYSNSIGAKTCIPCSAGKTTMDDASLTSTECSVLCPTGTARSGTDLNDCVPCKENYHAKNDGQPFCDPCPRGFSTEGLNRSVDCFPCADGTDNARPGTSCFEITESNSIMPQSSLFGLRNVTYSERYEHSSGNGGDDRKIVGIVLTAIGGTILIILILVLIIGGYFAYKKNKELQAIKSEIESLKDLQNNRM